MHRLVLACLACVGLARRLLNPVDTSSLTDKTTNCDGLLPQPEHPKFKVAIVSVSVDDQENGGSDKMLNRHRCDSIPLANGLIKQGMSCQIVWYDHNQHDKFFRVLSGFDAVLIRTNTGQIAQAGGNQLKFDKAMLHLEHKGKPVWPSPGVAAMMAKDALCKVKHLPFGLPDTFAYYTPEDLKRDFAKGIAYEPRVVKQNRGSAGEGIWIARLKSGNYCENLGDRVASGDEVLTLMEANDNHYEEHTIDEFIEFCIHGRTEKSGEWTSKGKGKYFAAGRKGGGMMVDQRYCPRISEGETRLLMVGDKVYRIEHYQYGEGVGGNYKQTIFRPDAPQWQECKDMLESSVPEIMKSLDLDMHQLPMIWAADFIPIDNHKSEHILCEFNGGCIGIAGFFDARGADLSASEDPEAGQKLCDLIGAKVLDSLTALKHTRFGEEPL